MGAYLESHARLSECGLYRYTLRRRWNDGTRRALFVMLNPSTADASVDDPTIRRCVGFARSWKCDSLEVVNLFALRSPNPQDLIDSAEAGIDPIGLDNDLSILEASIAADIVVAAWGAFGPARNRGAGVLRSLDCDVMCLGKTKDGAPRHPLYVKGDAQLITYRAPAPGAKHMNTQQEKSQ